MIIKLIHHNYLTNQLIYHFTTHLINFLIQLMNQFIQSIIIQNFKDFQ